jgi:hypothetical protein
MTKQEEHRNSSHEDSRATEDQLLDSYRLLTPKKNVAPCAGIAELSQIARWYLTTSAGGFNVQSVPFYCDPARIGGFAVDREELAAGTDAAVFKLFVTLSMYQALRDVVIARQQRSLSYDAMRTVADSGCVGRSIEQHACPALRSAEAFEADCDVVKRDGIVDCGTCPGVSCPVKDASRVFNRMGDMGKLPTSAWLGIWRDGGLPMLLEEGFRTEAMPSRRADALVLRFATVHRVGPKLATLFVSALSTPLLAPGLTPWFPAVDGNHLVVVDTNVARAVDALRAPGVAKTYEARATWVRAQAALIDLREFRADLPAYSPRIVQEALYVFCSKSNRVARGDACAQRRAPCTTCVPSVCPFAAGWTDSTKLTLSVRAGEQLASAFSQHAT